MFFFFLVSTVYKYCLSINGIIYYWPFQHYSNNNYNEKKQKKIIQHGNMKKIKMITSSGIIRRASWFLVLLSFSWHSVAAILFIYANSIAGFPESSWPCWVGAVKNCITVPYQHTRTTRTTTMVVYIQFLQIANHS